MTTQITALMTTAQMALTTKVSALQLIQVDAQWILSGCSNKSTKNFCKNFKMAYKQTFHLKKKYILGLGPGVDPN